MLFSNADFNCPCVTFLKFSACSAVAHSRRFCLLASNAALFSAKAPFISARPPVKVFLAFATSYSVFAPQARKAKPATIKAPVTGATASLTPGINNRAADTANTAPTISANPLITSFFIASIA